MMTVCIVAALLGASEPEGAARFIQDRFALVPFLDPPTETDLEARYREMAEANFTAVLVGGLDPADPEVTRRKLELCERFGMKAIVIQFGVEPEDYVTGPACWGYGVTDEPGADEFPALAELVEEIRGERPGKLALINLFPSYASPWGQLGAANYDEYVRQFVETVDVDVLCMDHYPLFRPDRPDGRDAYCGDLAVMREYALKEEIPFWNCFNVMPYGPHTDPSAGQMRWQMYASLAYGAKGLIYFCYWTPTHRAPDGTFEFPKGGAVIHADGRRSRHYGQAKRINGAIKNLGPTLMKLTSTGVYRVGPEDDPAEALEGSPLRTLEKADHDPPHDYLVGAFRHEDGRRGVLLQNYRFAYTAWPTVVFDAEPGGVLEVDPDTGAEIPPRDDSPELPGLQISLDTGEGRLFLLP